MSAFNDEELAYLTGEGRLARIAIVGEDGTPHVVPVGMWSRNSGHDTIDVGGDDLERTKKFRDAQRPGRASIVIDDVASSDPFTPRRIEIRGRAEAVEGPAPLIRIHPERIVSWGIGAATERPGQRNARTVKAE